MHLSQNHTDHSSNVKWDIPNSPWQEIAANFFTINNHECYNTLSKYPFLFQVTHKTAEATQHKFQHIFYNMDHPLTNTLTMGPLLHQRPSSYSNGFTERQVKPIKSTLTKAKTSKTPLDIPFLNICSGTIWPHMSSPKEILHNRIVDHARQPKRPVDFEAVHDYLTKKKIIQKRSPWQRHKATTCPELHPGQGVLFLSSDQLIHTYLAQS